jgi:hypothetical protein
VPAAPGGDEQDLVELDAVGRPQPGRGLPATQLGEGERLDPQGLTPRRAEADLGDAPLSVSDHRHSRVYLAT